MSTSRTGLATLLVAAATLTVAAAATTPASAGGHHMSHADAVGKLNAAGISVWSSGNCSDRNNSNCTSFDQVLSDTINGIITFKQASGCPITATGGTETGHGNGAGKSHWNGWKIDISINGCVDGYIKGNFRYVGERGDGPIYNSGAGNEYVRENGNHWDITYNNCGGCRSANTRTAGALG